MKTLGMVLSMFSPEFARGYGAYLSQAKEERTLERQERLDQRKEAREDAADKRAALKDKLQFIQDLPKIQEQYGKDNADKLMRHFFGDVDELDEKTLLDSAKYIDGAGSYLSTGGQPVRVPPPDKAVIEEDILNQKVAAEEKKDKIKAAQMRIGIQQSDLKRNLRDLRPPSSPEGVLPTIGHGVRSVLDFFGTRGGWSDEELIEPVWNPIRKEYLGVAEQGAAEGLRKVPNEAQIRQKSLQSYLPSQTQAPATSGQPSLTPDTAKKLLLQKYNSGKLTPEQKKQVEESGILGQ